MSGKPRKGGHSTGDFWLGHVSAGTGCCSGQSPEESLHATGHNRRNRIYLLLQALALAQTKEIQLQGCLGQTQSQSKSDSTEQASPLCLQKQMKFMCMILQKHLVHSLAPETSCSRISWLSPWSPCVYLLLTDACLGTVFPVWPKTLALAKHQSPTVLEE